MNLLGVLLCSAFSNRCAGICSIEIKFVRHMQCPCCFLKLFKLASWYLADSGQYFVYLHN
jgi:hypothetical protein